MPRIFVGNISHASSDVDLQQWIESMGFPVESIEIIHDRLTGKSRGFGFVSLRSEREVQAAISSLNGKEMNGRILTVNQALPLSGSPRRPVDLERKGA